VFSHNQLLKDQLRLEPGGDQHVTDFGKALHVNPVKQHRETTGLEWPRDNLDDNLQFSLQQIVLKLSKPLLRMSIIYKIDYCQLNVDFFVVNL
jgi:hypothetical protein